MAESVADQRLLETDLARKSPDDVRLALDISAPRPVITPFTLRFVSDDRGARFDACSADTEEARDRILGAAGRAGLQDKAECTIGMGVPSPRWAEAAELAIAAVDELGGGSVTFTDADVALRAPEGTPQDRFDDVVGGLETALPEVFALKATRPEPPADTETEVPEFIATLSPEGQVLLRGQLGSAQLRETAQSFAKARFASEGAHVGARRRRPAARLADARASRARGAVASRAWRGDGDPRSCRRRGPDRPPERGQRPVGAPVGQARGRGAVCHRRHL